MNENTHNDVSEKTNTSDIKSLITVENINIIRSYLLGYKKNGKPRAIYDVLKDRRESETGGKKKKKRKAEKFSLYIDPHKGKGKKKKKNKKKSHWEY